MLKTRLVSIAVLIVAAAISAVAGLAGLAVLLAMLAFVVAAGSALMRIASARRPGQWSYGSSDRVHRD